VIVSVVGLALGALFVVIAQGITAEIALTYLPNILMDMGERHMAEGGSISDMPSYMVPAIGIDVFLTASKAIWLLLGGMIAGLMTPRADYRLALAFTVLALAYFLWADWLMPVRFKVPALGCILVLAYAGVYLGSLLRGRPKPI